MTTYNVEIVDSNGARPAHGDHVTVTRTVTGLTTAQTISKAWLTVKGSPATDADVDADLQISTDDAGGSVTDPGTDATEGEVEFTISGTDYDDLAADATYHYDIQVLLSDDTVATLEVGKIRWNQDVTRTAS